MSETFSKLKALLDEKGSVSPEDIEKLTKEHGEMTPQEAIEFESLKLKKSKDTRSEVTMEQYLEATKVLDTAEEGSEEYKKAEAVVKAFESGG